VALRHDAKNISEQVPCKMRITAGRTKLAKNTIFHLFEHVHQTYKTKRLEGPVTLPRPVTLPKPVTLPSLTLPRLKERSKQL